MNNITEILNNNIEKAMRIIKQQKEQIKIKKNERLKAETRIEENEKGLQKDYEEVMAMGFQPDKIEEAIQELDKQLEQYNKMIMEYINVLNS